MLGRAGCSREFQLRFFERTGVLEAQMRALFRLQRRMGALPLSDETIEELVRTVMSNARFSQEEFILVLRKHIDRGAKGLPKTLKTWLSDTYLRGQLEGLEVIAEAHGADVAERVAH